MRGLLLRLSALDTSAESAVRIIAFFDGLTENRATMQALTRAAASFADCPVGVRDSLGNVISYSDPLGRPIVTPPPMSGVIERTFGRSPLWGTLWLERPDGVQPLDELLMERMAVAAGITLERQQGGATASPDSPALVRTLVNDRSSDIDRVRTGQQMGIRGQITVIALALASPAQSRLLALASTFGTGSGGFVRAATMDDETGCLILGESARGDLVGQLGGHLQPDERAGIGRLATVQEAAQSWKDAKRALAFARTSGTIVRADDLGARAVLASIPRAVICELPDVNAVARLAAVTGGVNLIESVEKMAEYGSVRRAAEAMHMHHSSLSHRLRQAEQILGFELDNNLTLIRAHLAVSLWRFSLLE